MSRATRDYESRTGGIGSERPPAAVGPEKGSVTVEITAAAQAVPESNSSDRTLQFVYLGVFVHREITLAGTGSDWLRYGETCWVYDVNDAELQVGSRYIGSIAGVYDGRALVEVESGGQSDCEAVCFRNVDPNTVTGVFSTDSCSVKLTYTAPQYCGPVCVSDTTCDDAESDCTQCVGVYTATLNGIDGALLSVPSSDGCTFDHTSSPKAYLRGCFSVSDEASPGSIEIISTEDPFYSTIDPDDCTTVTVTLTRKYLNGAFLRTDGTVRTDFTTTGRTHTRYLNLRTGLATNLVAAGDNRATLVGALADFLDTGSPYFGARIVLPPSPPGEDFHVTSPVNISSLHGGLRIGGASPDASTRLFGVEPTLQCALMAGNADDADTFGHICFGSNGTGFGLLYATFTAADNTNLNAVAFNIGPAGWTVLGGTGKITSNKAVPNALSGTNGTAQFKADAGNANADVTADFGSSNGCGVWLRVDVQENGWLCRDNAGTLQIYQAVAGTLTLRASQAGAATGAHTVHAVAYKDKITLSVGAVSCEYASATFNNTVTTHGIRFDTAGQTCDNFLAVVVPQQIYTAEPGGQIGSVGGFRATDPATGVYEVIMGAPPNSTQIRDVNQWMARPTAVTTLIAATGTAPAKLKIDLDRAVPRAATAYQLRWLHNAITIASVSGDTLTLEGTDDLNFFAGTAFEDFWLTDGAGINEVIGERVTPLRGSTVSGTSYIQLTRRVELPNETGYWAIVRLPRDLVIENMHTGYLPVRGWSKFRMNYVKTKSPYLAGLNPTGCADLVCEDCTLFGSLGPIDKAHFLRCFVSGGTEEWTRHVTYDRCRIEYNWSAQVGAEYLTFVDTEFNGDTEGLSTYIAINQSLAGRKTNHVKLIRCRVNDNAYPILIYGDYAQVINCEFAETLGVTIDGQHCQVEGNVGGTITFLAGASGVRGQNWCRYAGDQSGVRYYLTDANLLPTDGGGVNLVYFRDTTVDENGTPVGSHFPELGPAYSDPLTAIDPTIWTITSNRIKNTNPDSYRRLVAFLPVADLDWSMTIHTPASGNWATGFVINFLDNGNWSWVRMTNAQVALYQQLGAGTIGALTGGTGSHSFSNATDYTLRVYVKDDVVRVYVDGTLVVDYLEVGRALKTASGFGFQNFYDSGAPTDSLAFTNLLAKSPVDPTPWPAGTTARAVKGRHDLGTAAKNLTAALIDLDVPLTDSSTPEVYLEDSFTGPNGTALNGRALDYGGPWVLTGTGVFTVQSNKAELTTAGAGGTFLTADAGHADAVVEADVTFPSSNGEVALHGRYVDDNNYINVAFNDYTDANQVIVAKNVAGTPTTLATISHTFASSTTYKVGVSFEGDTIRVWVNGVVVTTVTESALNTATKFGINTFDPFGGGKFDNFRVRAVPRPVPVDLATVYGTAPAGLTFTDTVLAGVTRSDADYGAIGSAADGATVTFNLDTNNNWGVTIAGNRTLALSGGHDGQVFTIAVRQDGTGSRTVTWWAGISWPGAVVPTLTTTAGKMDVFEFWRLASGSYVGFVKGQNYT